MFFRVLKPEHVFIQADGVAIFQAIYNLKKKKEGRCFRNFCLLNHDVNDLKQSPEEPYPENPHPFLV